MSLKHIIIFLFLLGIAASAGAADLKQKIRETDEYIKDIKTQLEKEKQELDHIANTKKKLAAKLDNVQENIRLQETSIKNISAKNRLMKTEIQNLDKKLVSYTAEIKKLKKSISTSNIYLIDNADFVNIKLLLFSKHTQDTIKNMEIISKINVDILEKIKLMDKRKNELENIRKEKASKAADLKQLARVKSKLSKEYINEKKKYSQLIKVLGNDEESKKEYLNILSSKQKQFEKKLKSIQAQARKERLRRLREQRKKAAANRKNNVKTSFKDTGPGMGRFKRKLEWPLRGRIIERFGPKKVKGFKGTIQSKGIKIRPSITRAVRLVFDGTVIHKDRIRGFGNLIIVHHEGDYYTLYANMNKIYINKGQELKKGDKVGTVEVDSSPGTPYLYFEIRKHDTALNPVEWLK